MPNKRREEDAKKEVSRYLGGLAAGIPIFGENTTTGQALNSALVLHELGVSAVPIPVSKIKEGIKERYRRFPNGGFENYGTRIHREPDSGIIVYTLKERLVPKGYAKEDPSLQQESTFGEDKLIRFYKLTEKGKIGLESLPFTRKYYPDYIRSQYVVGTDNWSRYVEKLARYNLTNLIYHIFVLQTSMILQRCQRPVFNGHDPNGAITIQNSFDFMDDNAIIAARSAMQPALAGILLNDAKNHRLSKAVLEEFKTIDAKMKSDTEFKEIVEKLKLELQNQYSDMANYVGSL